MKRQLGPATKEFRTCSTGCDKPALARGLCAACYHAARRRGDLPQRESTEPLTSFKTWLNAEQTAEVLKLSRITGRSCSDILREATAEYLTKLREMRAAAAVASGMPTTS